MFIQRSQRKNVPYKPDTVLNLQYVPKVNQHKNQRNETEVKAV